jgi:lipopolysaccharide biosynthesis glycosyltransferase
MKKNVIVTGSDKKYYPFLKNLVNSLINSNSLDICDLCILDVEDNSQYLEELDSKITKKKKANFNLNILFKDRQDWFKLLTERPFMKDYFPGYDKYIWMDADTEVLSNDGIKNIIDACDDKDLAIAPEINESYVFKSSKFGIKKIFKSYYKISGWSFKNYRKYFSDRIGEDLFFKPLFNNGIFCLKSTSKIWDLWKTEYQGALNKAKTSYGIKTDQLSLNKIIYENFEKISILDSTNNWLVSRSEKIKMINNDFFTPSFPNRKINILHYTQLNFDDNFIIEEKNIEKKISIKK